MENLFTIDDSFFLQPPKQCWEAINNYAQNLKSPEEFAALATLLEGRIEQLNNSGECQAFRQWLRAIERIEFNRFGAGIFNPHPELMSDRQIYQIHCYLKRHPELFTPPVMYKRGAETGLPFSLQTDGRGRVFVHVKTEMRGADETRMILYGRGNYKSVRLAIQWGSFISVAVATPKPRVAEDWEEAIHSLRTERKILRKLKGKRGIIQLEGHTAYSFKRPSPEHPSRKVNLLLQEASDELYRLINEKAPLLRASRKKWACDLLYGLLAIHALGIIHRDIKPENILIVDDGQEAVIADFGFAQKKDTKNHLMHGTFMYWPPEVLEAAAQYRLGNDQEYDQLRQMFTQKIDVYSLGLILYLMRYKPPAFLYMKNIVKSATSIRNYIFEIAKWHRAFRPIDHYDKLVKAMTNPNPLLRITSDVALKYVNKL